MVLTTTTLITWLALKSIVRLPDGYAIDVDRNPPRYAVGVDRSNMVSVDVPGGTVLRGATISLRLDEEDRAFGSGADAVMLRIRWEY